MNRDDKLSEEIKNIYEEETKKLTLSDEFLNNLRKGYKKNNRERIIDFLNREIEIPLAPAFVGMAALIALSIIPKDILKNEQLRTIYIGSSEVIIREQKEVTRK
ncbi:MAG: hypothetical protein KGZ96_11010 [Clostridia bacterium]|nr:hypothetical protein [Clostridia bacterium]